MKKLHYLSLGLVLMISLLYGNLLMASDNKVTFPGEGSIDIQPTANSSGEIIIDFSSAKSQPSSTQSQNIIFRVYLKDGLWDVEISVNGQNFVKKDASDLVTWPTTLDNIKVLDKDASPEAKIKITRKQDGKEKIAINVGCN
jgi:hypothetical protein